MRGGGLYAGFYGIYAKFLQFLKSKTLGAYVPSSSVLGAHKLLNH